MIELLAAAPLPAATLALGLGATLALVLALLSESDANFVRGLGLMVLAVAGGFAAVELGDPALDAGLRLAGGAMVRDHLAAGLDLAAVGVGALALLGSGRGLGAGSSSLGAAIGAARRLGAEPLVLAVCTGASLVFHAGDLLTLLVGLELASLAAFSAALVEADRDGARALLDRGVRALALTTLLTGLGIALIYGATSSLAIYSAPEARVPGLGSRVAAVFTQWGAVQGHALTLGEAAADPAGTPLPSGLAHQLRGQVVTGMAPAALLIPGMLLLLGGLLARTPLVPFGSLWRGLAWSRDHGAGAGVLGAVLVPLVGLGALIRVFVAVLHASRLVSEPYGWIGPLPALAVLSALAAGLVATRQRDAARIVAWISTGALAPLLLGLVAAASFAGRGAARGVAVASAFELGWARLAAESALAGALLGLVAWAAATAALIVGLRVLSPATTDLVGVAAAARRDRVLALALAVALASLLGLPPLLGGVSTLAVLRTLTEHSSLRGLLLPLGVAWCLLGVSGWRLVVALFPVGEPGPGAATSRLLEPRGASSTNPGRAASRTGVLVVALLLSLGAALGSAPSRLAEIAAAGTFHGLGSSERAARVEAVRARLLPPADPTPSRVDPEPAGVEGSGEVERGDAGDGDAGAGDAGAGGVDPDPAG